MKTLITHINPHLDDIAAIWLFKKFHPEYSEARQEFISQSQTDQIKGGEDSETVFFGVGKGKFDEHKGDLQDCSTSLVWKEIKNSGLVPSDEIEARSFEQLVEWVRLVDLGQTSEEFDAYSIPAFIRPVDGNDEDSQKAVKLGAEILDRVLEVLKRNNQSEKDWQGRVELITKFGQIFAVKSETISRAFCKEKGGDLFLIMDPKKGWAQYFTPKDLNLEPIYLKLKQLEPESDWYLHQSHHFVLCGAGSSPDASPTRLTFEQLLEVAKQV